MGKYFEPVDKTLQDAAAANGNGTEFVLNGRHGTLTLQISGTFSATINFEASIDGTNYIAIRGINKNTGNGATTATAAGIFQFSVPGAMKFRARVSSYASGNVTVTATAVPASEPANQATTTMGTVAIDQTTPGTTNAVQLIGRIYKEILLNETGAPTTIPASSYSEYIITGLANELEAGFLGADTFTNNVGALKQITAGYLSDITAIIVSGSRSRGIGRGLLYGNVGIVRWYNEDAGAAHSINRYLAKIY